MSKTLEWDDDFNKMACELTMDGGDKAVMSKSMNDTPLSTSLQRPPMMIETSAHLPAAGATNESLTALLDAAAANCQPQPQHQNPQEELNDYEHDDNDERANEKEAVLTRGNLERSFHNNFYKIFYTSMNSSNVNESQLNYINQVIH